MVGREHLQVFERVKDGERIARQLVVVEQQFLQVGQLGQLGRQPIFQHVAAEIECLQVGRRSPMQEGMAPTKPLLAKLRLLSWVS